MNRLNIAIINRLIAFVLVKFRRVIFYSNAYRYRKDGSKVEWKYLYWIEHRAMPRKSNINGRIIDMWLRAK